MAMVPIRYQELVMIDRSTVPQPRLSATRSALAGAFMAVGVFIVCWAAAALGIRGSHAFIGLFTLAPFASGSALMFGGAAAAGFGALAGALMAVGYKLTAGLSAR